MDILGLFGIDVVGEIQDFFASIIAWVLGLISDLTGIDFDFGDEA